MDWMKSKSGSAAVFKRGSYFLGFAFLIFLIALIYYNFNFAYTVQGSVVLKTADEAAVPPGSRLIVQLEDVSDQAGGSLPIAEQTIEDVSLPADFKIRYDPGEITPDGTYAVSADVYDKDFNLVFDTETTYNVLTGGHPSRVEIQLIRVQVEDDPGGSESPAGGEETDGSPTGSVTGNVFFDDSQLPPGDSFLVLRLHDVSLGDIENNVIAETAQSATESPEVFELTYGLDSVRASNAYNVSALIRDSEENILFRSETAYDVITNGNPNQIDIELVPAER